MEAQSREKSGSQKEKPHEKMDVPPINKETLLTYNKELDEFTRREQTVENEEIPGVNDDLVETRVDSFKITYKKTFSNINIKMVIESSSEFLFINFLFWVI